MWGLIVASVSMVVVLMTSITLYMQQEKLKTEVNSKLNSVVDQINDSQLYEFNFDKQQEGNIKNVDQNISTLYDAVVEAQKNVEFLKNTTVTREQLNKAFQSDQIKTNVLTLGSKFSMSGVGDGQGNDDWLRISDKTGTDYYGGLAAKKLWSRDEANFNGKTEITGKLFVNNAHVVFKGGSSDFNPNEWSTFLPYIDGKNYIRGDTQIMGRVSHIGSFQSDNVKLGPRTFTQDSPLTVYSTVGKWGASFGSEGGLWSHFPGRDQSTYIRPGRDGADINIGDLGAANVNIGKGNTAVNVKGDVNVNGQICIGDSCLTAADIRKLKTINTSGVTGRFIRIYADDNLTRTLHLTEVEVYDAADANVAAGKTTISASSTKNNDRTLYGPQYLTDRVMTSLVSGAWRLASTNDEPKPWFKIDLGQDYPIKKIIVYNRDDSAQDKFIGFKVAILNASEQILYSQTITEAKASYTFII